MSFLPATGSILRLIKNAPNPRNSELTNRIEWEITSVSFTSMIYDIDMDKVDILLFNWLKYQNRNKSPKYLFTICLSI